MGVLGAGTPRDRPAALGPLARGLVRAGVAPAVAVGSAVHVRDAWVSQTAAAGRLDSERGAAGAAAATDTLFDLASLTKPLVALAAARLARAKHLDFRAPLVTWLPEVGGTPSRDAPLELLLAHRAGLAGYGALYRHLQRGQIVPQRELLIEAASARQDATDLGPEGTAPVYSDLGYLLAGEAIARASGLDLDVAIEREVLAPLGAEIGSARWLFARDAGFRRRVAPTERVPWRGGVVRGFVHDENAWAYAGEGCAGHAGMFGTVQGVLAIGRALVDALRGRLDAFLTPVELDRLVGRRTLGTLRAGFDGKSETSSSAGSQFGPNTVGHLGFTGTSIWCDPDREWVGVVLTNRVHPTRSNDAIRAARPLAYDAIADWAVATASISD
jgi:CubicO group peptidase (beta-lactamase class C family)